MRHQESGTIMGGPRGVVWVARCLIMTLANVGAALGKFNPPCPAPEGYELDRVSTGTWPRAIKWAKLWRDELTKSNAILQQSAAERLQPVEPVNAPAEGDSTGTPVGESEEPRAKSTRARPKKQALTPEPSEEQTDNHQRPGRKSKTEAKARTAAKALRRQRKGSDDDDESDEGESDKGESDEGGWDKGGSNKDESDEEEDESDEDMGDPGEGKSDGGESGSDQEDGPVGNAKQRGKKGILSVFLLCQSTHFISTTRRQGQAG